MGWANRLRMLLQKLTSDDLLFLFVSFFFSEGGGRVLVCLSSWNP